MKLRGGTRVDKPRPRHVLMTLNRLSPEKMQAVHDGPIFSVSIFGVLRTRSRMGNDKTEAGFVVTELDANSAFVTRHAA